MKPITRKEFYLAKAAGTYTGPTPPPVLREDYYLATLAGDYSGSCPAPVTRLDMFMSAAAGITSYVPQPITRIEMYWYAIAKGAGYVPEPVTREEKFLYAILKNPPKPEYLDKTAEGSLILLPDSAEAPFTALTVYGHSTQETTTGAQLFDASLITNLSTDGVEVINNGDGSFTVTGSTVTTGKLFQHEFTHEETIKLLKPGIIHFLNSVNEDVNPKIFVRFFSGTNLIKDITFNGTYEVTEENINDENFVMRYMINAYVDLSVISGLMKPMLYQDGDGTWEPYTGSKPSPSPEYPQPIESAGDSGQIEVTVQGGNLLDSSEMEIGGLSGSSGKDFDATNRIRTGFIAVTSGEIYTLSGYSPYNIANSHVFQSDKETRIDSFKPGVAVPENGAWVRISFQKADQGDFTEADLEALKNTLVFNMGSTSLPYEPYKLLQTLTIQTPNGLPGIPVTASSLPDGVEPTYTDESGQAWICDEVDFKRGVYVQRVWRRTFDGSEDWILYGNSVDSYSGFYISNVLPQSATRIEGISNQFDEFGVDVNLVPQMWLGIKGRNIYAVGIKQRDFSLEDGGLANWKAHLAAHPLEVMTYLETPIETDLSDEEMAAYKAMHTYSPTTTVSNDAGAWMKVGYKAPVE